ncbi:hypothetical protein [Anaeromyxobacter paludicola]|uniref:Lipoprotein n=1 Tax=Anaeromyxobacter paludicola TaxID=2918171 RepID=A0ABN6N8G7_9BACT|nr:hypothetical protein [Anaeromyxobacter paludicola]BDG08242.1 hypothetical protein AMPC_13550 [Anaeromyxobacter paludicola]
MPTRAALPCLALLVLLPLPALARPWNGITPGASTAADVAQRFGEPSTKGRLGGRSAMIYKGDQAIDGTRQAQFFTRDDGRVLEVTVFPSAQLDKEAVEGTYGKGAQKTFTDDFRPVWLYRSAGVMVFFGRDGYVEAITFKQGDAPAAPHARAGEPAAP